MIARRFNWFEIKVSYLKVTEEGLEKTVKETYVVDAKTFGKAEEEIQERLQKEEGIIVEQVLAITRAKYDAIDIPTNPGEDDKWYKVKVILLYVDENEKAKRVTNYYLVKDATLAKALDRIDEIMRDSMTDYVSASGSETSIVKVFA